MKRKKANDKLVMVEGMTSLMKATEGLDKSMDKMGTAVVYLQGNKRKEAITILEGYGSTFGGSFTERCSMRQREKS